MATLQKFLSIDAPVPKVLRHLRGSERGKGDEVARTPLSDLRSLITCTLLALLVAGAAILLAPARNMAR